MLFQQTQYDFPLVSTLKLPTYPIIFLFINIYVTIKHVLSKT